jgi:hypothetical protein
VSEAPTEERLSDRAWIWWEGREPRAGFVKPLPRHNAVEYMRVLSREEVEKLLNSKEGCDTQQLLNSLYRQIEGQRRHIARLEAEKKAHRCHHALDEALNSGDGSYRP